MTEKTSARRYVFDRGGGIGHLLLHHVPGHLAVARHYGGVAD
jgi:hypothetical protein